MTTETIKHTKSLYLIGIGPGCEDLRLPLADARLQKVTDIVGYDFYFPFVQSKYTTQNYHASELGSELDRARLALDLAAAGKATALVSSGDIGIYAMAAVVFELLHREHNIHWQELAIEVVPGISAMQTLSARVGAVLGHDFCAISLSDLLTPWPVIEKRLQAAASGDFVVALYNPVSKKRDWQLDKAQSILLGQRDAGTPVAIGRNLSRADERLEIIRLDELRADRLDMLCIVIIGNSSSVVFDHNHTKKMYTPRGYQTE